MNTNTEDQIFTESFPEKVPLGVKFTVIILCLFAASDIMAFSSQPPANRTGAPPENMTCASCHTGSGSGSLSLVLDGGISSYVPGESYPMEVVVSDPGQMRFGFSMVSRITSSPTTPTGSWTAGPNSSVYDFDRHIGHNDAPFAQGGYTFNVQWTAPAQDVGDITFYAAANAANGNFSNGAGDNIYTRQLTISAAQPFETFWADSPLEQGWRVTSQGYPGSVGVGIIFDQHWPFYFTYAQSENSPGDWIYVFEENGSIDGYWAYNLSGGYFFYAFPSVGWYYSLQIGAEGWYPFVN